jgi:glutamine synthetase
MDSVAALNDSDLFRKELGSQFVDYMIALKEGEIGRFLQHVTDWEHQEYFEIF